MSINNFFCFEDFCIGLIKRRFEFIKGFRLHSICSCFDTGETCTVYIKVVYQSCIYKGFEHFFFYESSLVSCHHLLQCVGMQSWPKSESCILSTAFHASSTISKALCPFGCNPSVVCVRVEAIVKNFNSVMEFMIDLSYWHCRSVYIYT